jgi:ketosteroid isomerase-like protein
VPHDLTPGDGQDTLARFKEARERRDPERMLHLFAQDAEYRDHPFEPPLTGSVAIREHWNRVAAQQVEVDFDAERVWVSGRTVLASWHVAYTLRATADRLRERGFCTMELDDEGRVSRMRAWPVVQGVGRDSMARPQGAPVEAGEGQHGG